MNDESFFIGWESKTAPSLRAFLLRISIALVLMAVVSAVWLSASQKTLNASATFDFGNVKSFSGVLMKEPVPMLIGDDGTTYYLVAPLKNGFPESLASSMHLQQVELQGTLIGDSLDSMIEAVPESVRALGDRSDLQIEASDEGVLATLQGEIVDSKCHLGVMNPGRFKPHRACAIQCLSGGIPPILVLEDGSGALSHVLLVAADGRPVNEAILEYVAEPVEVSGTLKQIGGRQVLYMDPGQTRRL